MNMYEYVSYVCMNIEHTTIRTLPEMSRLESMINRDVMNWETLQKLYYVSVKSITCFDYHKWHRKNKYTAYNRKNMKMFIYSFVFLIYFGAIKQLLSFPCQTMAKGGLNARGSGTLYTYKVYTLYTVCVVRSHI